MPDTACVPSASVSTYRVPLAERLSEHRRMTVALAKISIPPRDEGEWDAFGIEPLGYRIHRFAIS